MEIKPCPFCGATVLAPGVNRKDREKGCVGLCIVSRIPNQNLGMYWNEYRVVCSNCNTKGPKIVDSQGNDISSEDKAINEWNRVSDIVSKYNKENNNE